MILLELHPLQTAVRGRAGDGALGADLLMPHQPAQIFPELASKLGKLTPWRENNDPAFSDNNFFLLMSDSLYERCGQTACIVSKLPSAGWTMQHPAPAGLADDVTCSRWSSDVTCDLTTLTCGAAGDGQVPGYDQTYGALHHGLQVTSASVGAVARSRLRVDTWDDVT